MTAPTSPDTLPSDNAARIAIYDVLAGGGPAESLSRLALTEGELFERVIGRLRILVPRELHLLGEREYVSEKIQACVDGGILDRVADDPQRVMLTGQPPQIRYPDGTVRDYEAGLEAARERLELDDMKLRRGELDVHKLVPSLADAQDSEAFRALVGSMQEHGYLKQFRIQRGANGDVIDGRARIAAAAIAGVPAEEMTDRLPQRRDTPLHRVLLALDANWGRISDEDRERVYEVVSARTGRTWARIEADLALTRDWRRAIPRDYKPWFDVKKVRFRPSDQPNVQITKDPRDRKVMLRSLLEAAGLSNYKINDLRGYVVMERARTDFSANQKAIFVGIADAIAGIEAMQQDRRRKNRRLEPQWDTIRQWLVHRAGRMGETDAGDARPPSPAEAEAVQPV